MPDIATSTIAQQAFRELGLRPLSSYADDTPEAVAADETFGTARDMVLQSYDWSVCRRTVTPPALTDGAPDPDPDMPYAYALPAATLAVRAVLDAGQWRREGHILLADVTPVRVRITHRPDREDDLPATLRHAMALQMALLLAPSYVATRAKRADLEATLAQALAQARMNDRTSGSATRLDGRDVRHGDDWPDRVVL